jgi:hypothetical protein
MIRKAQWLVSTMVGLYVPNLLVLWVVQQLAHDKITLVGKEGLRSLPRIAEQEENHHGLGWVCSLCSIPSRALLLVCKFFLLIFFKRNFEVALLFFGWTYRP